jgi:hypothetical protein
VSGTRDVKTVPFLPLTPQILRASGQLKMKFQALYPGARGMIAIGFFANSCSPGADVRAIFLRVSMLRMLQMLSESGD